jgi:hypothetical protein
MSHHQATDKKYKMESCVYYRVEISRFTSIYVIEELNKRTIVINTRTGMFCIKKVSGIEVQVLAS